MSIHAFRCDKDGGEQGGRKKQQDDRRAEIQHRYPATLIATKHADCPHARVIAELS